MSNPKAQAEKEKGNAAFKKGDYPTAIGHYTAASLADRTDPTFPLNRAAAYLKLGKNEDAERDCTIVLSLSALNTKALFRRGQARIGLEKLDGALADLTLASQREPENGSVKEEIKKVNELIAKRKPIKPKSIRLAPMPSSKPPKRRRVPIKILDSTSTAVPTTPPPPSTAAQPTPVLAKQSPPEFIEASSSNKPPSKAPIDTLKPLSTRSLKKKEKEPPQSPAEAESPPLQAYPSGQPKPTPKPGPYSSWRADPQPPSGTGNTAATPSAPGTQPSTFNEARQAREARVGGGIFRASGTSTIFPPRSSPGTPLQASPSPAHGKGTGSGIQTRGAPAKMMTLFDFSKAWEMERGVGARWGLIQTIPPSALSALFKTSLEPGLFVSIVAVFEAVLDGAAKDDAGVVVVEAYMRAFGKVDRFSTVVLFLSKEEKARVRRVWEMLEVVPGEGDAAWKPIWT